MTDLPPGWNLEPLGSVCSVVSGTTPKGLASVEGGSVPFYKVGDMNAADGLVMGSARTYLDEAAVTNLRLRVQPPGTVIFPKNGGAVATNKKRVLALRAAYDLNTMGVTPGPTVDGRYLLHWLQTVDMNTISSGSVVPKINQTDVQSLLIPVPPLDDQYRIVASIEEQLSRLEEAERLLTSAGLRLRGMKKAIFDSVIPAEVPADWRQVTVGQAGAVDLGRQRSPKDHHGPNMRPYLRVANVFEDRIFLGDVMEMNFTPEQFERSRLLPGDILLNEGQSPELVGRPAMYRGDPPDVAFTNSLIRFRPGPGVDGEFALLVFRRHLHSGRFRREARITTNIAHMAAGRFKEVEFPVPPITEQERIVARVHGQLSHLDALQQALRAATARSGALRRSILRCAFRGQLGGAVA